MEGVAEHVTHWSGLVARLVEDGGRAADSRRRGGFALRRQHTARGRERGRGGPAAMGTRTPHRSMADTQYEYG